MSGRSEGPAPGPLGACFRPQRAAPRRGAAGGALPGPGRPWAERSAPPVRGPVRAWAARGAVRGPCLGRAARCVLPGEPFPRRFQEVAVGVRVRVRLCGSGQRPGCPRKGARTCLRVRGVLSGRPCARGWNRPVEEMTRHADDGHACFTADVFSVKRCLLVSIESVQQERCAASVEERKGRPCTS